MFQISRIISMSLLPMNQRVLWLTAQAVSILNAWSVVGAVRLRLWYV